MLLFDRKTDYPNLVEPLGCPNKTRPNSTLILFGIKSTPDRNKIRDAIRNTWLNRKSWEFNPEIEIHFIFLLGRSLDQNAEISEEGKQFGDILQTDFAESHYNLSIKDVDFFNYIGEKCPQVDYVVKGDDDIMIVPHNLAYIIQGLEETKVGKIFFNYN